jgi:hypothetical protein
MINLGLPPLSIGRLSLMNGFLVPGVFTPETATGLFAFFPSVFLDKRLPHAFGKFLRRTISELLWTYLNKPGVGLQTRFSTALAGIYLPAVALLLHSL